jgi:hypothetical protein
MMPPIKGIEQFRDQINLLGIRRDVMGLRQELESQKVSIAQTRRRLPRGWYRHSPTVNLEVSLNVQPVDNPVCLPHIWPQSLAHNSHRQDNSRSQPIK